MAKVKFENGVVVNFNGTPSKQDIEEVAQKLNISKTPKVSKEAEKGFGRKVVDFFTKNEQAFGQTLGDSLAVNSKDYKDAAKSQAGLDDMNVKLGKAIITSKNEGKDTTRLERLYQENTGRVFKPEEIAPSINKSAKQIIGEGVGVAADIASFGKYGQGLGKSSSAKEAFVRGFGKYGAEGAAMGTAYGLSDSLQENNSAEDITKDTLIGGISGAIIGGLVGGISERSRFLKPQKAQELKEKAIAQYKKGLQATKEKYKDKSDKIIPELLDKKWWGTRKSLVEKAEKGIKLAEDDYRKLGELKGVVKIDGLIKNIDDQVSKYTLSSGRVSSVNKQRVRALQDLKADILAVDAFDNIKDNVASQQKLRELAQDYGAEIYQTRKAQKTIMDNKTLSQVKKVDSSIRSLLNTDPRNLKYYEINKVYHLNTELAEILSETAYRKEGHKVIGLVRALSGGGGLATGAFLGGLPGALLTGAGLTALTETINSTWWNTLRAVQKNNIADKLIKKAGEEMSYRLMLLSRYGIKYADHLLSEDNSNENNQKNEQNRKQ